MGVLGMLGARIQVVAQTVALHWTSAWLTASRGRWQRMVAQLCCRRLGIVFLRTRMNAPTCLSLKMLPLSELWRCTFWQASQSKEKAFGFHLRICVQDLHFSTSTAQTSAVGKCAALPVLTAMD